MKAKQWIGMTVAGWFVGFAITLGLATVWESFHLGSQAIIGIGMGAGVGLTQGRLISHFGISGWKWFGCSLVGMSIPYLLYDAVGDSFALRPEQALPYATAVGSILVGSSQYLILLKQTGVRGWRWVGVSFVGWTLAHVMLTAIDLKSIKSLDLPPVVAALLVLVLILGGGPLLGWTTSSTIRLAVANVHSGK